MAVRYNEWGIPINDERYGLQAPEATEIQTPTLTATAPEPSGASKTGSMLTQGEMMAANPYMAAAGLGLQALGSARDAKNKAFAERKQRILSALQGMRGAVV